MTSKITSKGQTTLPKEIRDKLGVRFGDTLVYEVEGNSVRVREAEPFDLAWHQAISPTLAEWTPLTITRISKTCDAFEVVVLPFPFTGSDKSVKRPAAVLSRRAFNAEGHTVMAMITDARNQPWPLDIHIDHQSAGLKMPSVVRMKFFTLDNRLVIRRIGRLSPVDRQNLLDSLRQILPPEASAERAAP